MEEKLLKLPPYHYLPHPIEIIWRQVKDFVAKKKEALINMKYGS
jgi:hypothetical protein